MTNSAESYIDNVLKHVISTNVTNNEECAPHLKNVAVSCISLDILINMVHTHNKYINNGKNKIITDSNYATLYPNKYKKYLYHQLNKEYSDKCTTPQCWMTLEFIQHMSNIAKQELLKYTFRPKSPYGKFEWLSTHDINDVLVQYERKDIQFKSFGSVPMDFAKFSYEITNADYQLLYDMGIRKIGVVFNLDNHDQGGSHWVALFCNFSTGEIYYFDSVGVRPRAPIRKLMNIQYKFLLSIGFKKSNIRMDWNKIQCQFKNTECGVYCLLFIIKMCTGVNFYTFCKKKINDDKVNECRAVFFDKKNKKNKRK